MYLEEIADQYDQDFKRLLKQEAKYFIDEFLNSLEIIFRGDEYSRFGTQINLTTGKPMLRRNTHFEFRTLHCHIYFNDDLHHENNMMMLLRYEFLLDKDEIKELLSRGIKKFLRENNYVIERKIKVFGGGNFH